MDSITLKLAEELQSVYDLVNECLFGGVLTKDVHLGFAHLPRCRDGGTFLGKKWDEKDRGECHEIKIDEHLLSLGKPFWLTSLVHQMVHLLQYEHGTLPPHGRHSHNKEFVDIMENFGLLTTACDSGRSQKSRTGDKVQHSIDPEGKFQKMIQILGDRLIISSQPRNAGTQLDVSAKAPKSIEYKYFCPRCNDDLTSFKPDKNVICGDCNVRYKPDSRSH